MSKAVPRMLCYGDLLFSYTACSKNFVGISKCRHSSSAAKNYNAESSSKTWHVARGRWRSWKSCLCSIQGSFLNYAPLNEYAKLSKARLTGLVTATAAYGYLVDPEPFFLSSFVLCIVGTAGLASCANSINQFLEVPFDSQMKRTQNRPLVKGKLTPLHGITFALCSGGAGFFTLACVNSTAAVLGLANVILYSAVYTPLKRISVCNTWVGAVVGAIPPLIGCAASSGGHLFHGALVLAAILYSWQFPHFNSLSWNIRQEYAKAGYRMTAVLNPDLCCKGALRHSLALSLLCTVAAPLAQLTTAPFALTSLPLNAWLVALSWRFYEEQNSSSSRRLFRYSLIYLPAVLTLALIHKKKKIVVDKTESVNV